MTGDEKIVLIRERVVEAERLIRQAIAILPPPRDTRVTPALEKAADSLQGLDVLMRPRSETPGLVRRMAADRYARR